MTPEDQWEYASIIAYAFHELEIEHLEGFADYYIDCIEAGEPVDLPESLVLDLVRRLREGGSLNEGTDG